MPEMRAEGVEGGMTLDMYRVKRVEVVKIRFVGGDTDPFAITKLYVTGDGEAIQIQLYHEAGIDLLPAKEEK